MNSQIQGQGAIAAAMFGASAELRNIEKSRVTTDKAKFKNYASLDDVLVAVRPILHKHGLMALQDVGGMEDGTVVSLTTTLLHSSGQSMLFGPMYHSMGGIPNLQQVGQAVTYMRRYQLLAALGITTGFDEDEPWTSPVADERVDSRRQTTPLADATRIEEQERQAKAARRAAEAKSNPTTSRPVAETRPEPAPEPPAAVADEGLDEADGADEDPNYSERELLLRAIEDKINLEIVQCDEAVQELVNLANDRLGLNLKDDDASYQQLREEVIPSTSPERLLALLGNFTIPF